QEHNRSAFYGKARKITIFVNNTKSVIVSVMLFGFLVSRPANHFDDVIRMHTENWAFTFV
uniref:hypothetical protein n=1 Tax=Salmonella sp. s54395 TaxID=3159664 RepID=UPI0039806AF4